MGEYALIARQGGIVSREQAIAIGLSPSTVSRRVRSRQWFVVLPGVYRHSAAGLDGELMVRAVMLWAGPDAVLSGAWAAWWHGLGPEPSTRIGITVSRRSGLRSRALVRICRSFLDPADVVSVRGVRVVDRPLAALQCADALGGGDVLDRALQKHVKLADLDRTLERLAGKKGAAPARSTLEERRPGGVSVPERRLLRAFRSAGMTQIKAGVKIQLDGHLLWLDFAVEEIRLAIEVDGVAVHTQVETFQRDRWRGNLLEMHHWHALHYTPRRIDTDLDAVLAEVAGFLG